MSEETRNLDHTGIHAIAGEGLRGGGTIDKNFGFGLAIYDLKEVEPRLGTEYLVWWDPEEGEHFKVKIEDLVNLVMRFGPKQKLEEMDRRVKKLEELSSLLDILSRVEALEKR